jgi:hypothetical protein
MNRNLTIGLVVIFAGLLLYVLLVERPGAGGGEATPTAPVTTYLWSLTADQITGMRLEDRASGRAVELAKDASGAWSLQEPGPQPAEQTSAASAISGLTSLAVNSTITTTTDLAPFGVLSPTYQLQVSLSDGRRLVAAIGDKAPTGSAYYVLREGETNVVTINTFGIDSLIGLLDNPPVVPPTATGTVPAGTESAGTPAPEGSPSLTPAPVTATP